MAWAFLLRRRIVVAAAAAALLAQSSASARKTPDMPPAASSNALSAAAFLTTLKRIADAGSLFRPDETAMLLGTPLRKATTETQRPCTADATSRWLLQATTMSPPVSWWYRTQASAPGRLEIPAAFINPASTSGNPSFDYNVHHAIDGCAGSSGLKDSTEARLVFNGLPSFACLTPNQILETIPGANYQMATDEVLEVNYEGLVDEESGTTLRFSFRVGVSCALSVSVDQYQTSGLRALRAQSKFSSCRAVARQRWCALHGPVSSNDWDAIERIDLDGDSACGTFDSFYRRESTVDTQPLPGPQRQPRSQPCDQ